MTEVNTFASCERGFLIKVRMKKNKEMNKFLDANLIYKAGTRAINACNFKYANQLYEMNHLLETAKLQRNIKDGTYIPRPGMKFPIVERGKTRFISNNNMVDKTMNHLLCDEVFTPAITPYLQYDNAASQKNKGTDFYRVRFEKQLHDFYNKYGDNKGWILFIDFSGFYANIPHEKCIEVCNRFLDKSNEDKETIETAKWMIRQTLKTMEMDVSRFSDDEIRDMYESKISDMLNYKVSHDLLTGEKMLRKGVDIGNLFSQGIGITYPHKMDDYVTIVASFSGYGRYVDDSHVMSRDKASLVKLLMQLRKIAAEYGIIINDKKTKICDLSKPFKHLQEQWMLLPSGKVVRHIGSKSITRERRRLKAYKRLYNQGKLSLDDIENTYKSWIGKQWKVMSWMQLYSINQLYLELFNKPITWKKGHGRLNFMLNHNPNEERKVTK